VYFERLKRSIFCFLYSRCYNGRSSVAVEKSLPAHIDEIKKKSELKDGSQNLFLLCDFCCVDILLTKITQNQQSSPKLLNQNVPGSINPSKIKVHYD